MNRKIVEEKAQETNVAAGKYHWYEQKSLKT